MQKWMVRVLLIGLNLVVLSPVSRAELGAESLAGFNELFKDKTPPELDLFFGYSGYKGQFLPNLYSLGDNTDSNARLLRETFFLNGGTFQPTNHHEKFAKLLTESSIAKIINELQTRRATPGRLESDLRSPDQRAALKADLERILDEDLGMSASFKELEDREKTKADLDRQAKAKDQEKLKLFNSKSQCQSPDQLALLSHQIEQVQADLQQIKKNLLSARQAVNSIKKQTLKLEPLSKQQGEWVALLLDALEESLRPDSLYPSYYPIEELTAFVWGKIRKKDDVVGYYQKIPSQFKGIKFLESGSLAQKAFVKAQFQTSQYDEIKGKLKDTRPEKVAESLLESPDKALYYAAAYEQFDQLIPPLVKQGAQNAEVIFDEQAGNQGKVSFPYCMEATIQNLLNWKKSLPDTASSALKNFRKDFPRVDPLDARRRNAWATLMSNLQKFGVTYSEKKKILGQEFQYNMHPTVDNLLKVCEHLLYPGNQEYSERKTRSAQLDFLTQYLSHGDRKLTWKVPGHQKSSEIDAVNTDVEIEFSLDGKSAFKFQISKNHAEPSSKLKEKGWMTELYPHLEKLALARAGNGPILRHDREVLIAYSTDEQKQTLAKKYLEQGDLKNAYPFLLSRSDLFGVSGRISLVHTIVSHKLESLYPMALKAIQSLPQEDLHVQFGLANALIQFKKPSPNTETGSALKVLKDKFIKVAEDQEIEAWKEVASYGWSDLTKHLFKRNPNLRDSKDFIGRTLLNRAASSGALDIVKYLVKNGADKNDPSELKHTPLFSAALKGHLEIVEYLIQAKADLNQPDENGLTPIHSAANKGHVEVVQALIKAGAKLDTQDKDGEAPLHIAAYAGHVEVVQALIKAGAKLDARDEEGRTPLHIAVLAGEVKVVEALIQAKADLNQPDKEGTTSLEYAASTGLVEVVQALIKAGADIADIRGLRSIHAAAYFGHVEVVRYLREHGVDIEKTNQGGFTPLAHAVFQQRFDVVQYLISQGANPLAKTTHEFGSKSILDLAKNPDSTSNMENQVKIIEAIEKYISEYEKK
jgi:ankyrin repeat protein